MADDRLPRMVLSGIVEGVSCKGRPVVKLWLNCARNDLAKLRLLLTWRSDSQHRGVSMDTIRLLLQST